MSGVAYAIVVRTKGAFDSTTYHHPTKPLVAVWIDTALIGGEVDHWQIWHAETFDPLHAFPAQSLIDNGEWAMAAYEAIEAIKKVVRK